MDLHSSLNYNHQLQSCININSYHLTTKTTNYTLFPCSLRLNLTSKWASKRHFAASYGFIQVSEVNVHSVSDCVTSQCESCHSKSWLSNTILKICGTGTIPINSPSVDNFNLDLLQADFWHAVKIICKTCCVSLPELSYCQAGAPKIFPAKMF